MRYPTSVKIPRKVTISEVLRAAKRTKPDTALGPNSAPNRVIKIIVYNLSKILTRLF